jgi:hypothetical protein
MPLTRDLGALFLAIGLSAPYPAEAECAWVLWVKEEGRFSPMEAASTKGECDQGVVKYERLRQGLKLRPGLTYYCLPDTIDPRGPKGAGR